MKATEGVHIKLKLVTGQKPRQSSGLTVTTREEPELDKLWLVQASSLRRGQLNKLLSSSWTTRDNSKLSSPKCFTYPTNQPKNKSLLRNCYWLLLLDLTYIYYNLQENVSKQNFRPKPSRMTFWWWTAVSLGRKPCPGGGQ